MGHTGVHSKREPSSSLSRSLLKTELESPYSVSFARTSASFSSARKRARIHNNYRAGTTLEYAEALINFDRQLRMLTLDGIERIEISLRTQLGYVLGRKSAFAHLDPTNFVNAFTDPVIDPETGEEAPSKHEQWIERVEERRAASDETFVAHFREKYDNAMPIWALTEILELGQLGRLYGGLNSSIATEIASTYDVPTK